MRTVAARIHVHVRSTSQREWREWERAVLQERLQTDSRSSLWNAIDPSLRWLPGKRVATRNGSAAGA